MYISTKLEKLNGKTNHIYLFTRKTFVCGLQKILTMKESFFRYLYIYINIPKKNENIIHIYSDLPNMQKKLLAG